MKIGLRSARDLVAGLLFVGFGLVGLIGGRHYAMGSAERMGPGYFPVLLSGGLMLLGSIIAIHGLLSQDQPIESASPRPLLAVLFSVALFGLTLERFGLVASIPLVVLVMAFATPERRWLEVAVSALVMSVFCIVVFVVGLNQQLRIWGF